MLSVAVLHSALAGAADPESAFTWRDLTDGNVTHTVTNSGKTAEKWTAKVVALAAPTQGAPQLVAEPESIPEVAPGKSEQFRLRLDATAKPALGSSFRYLLTIERASGNEKTTERQIFRIRPDLWLVPQGQTAKYVFTATRAVPFLDQWQIKSPLRLVETPNKDRIDEGRQRPLGVLYTAGQASSMDHSAVVSWGPDMAGDAQAIPLKLDFPKWSSAKLAGMLNFPDGQTREIVVQTSDYIIYPLVVIVAGVVTAYGVKRYVTRGRALLVLRANLADTEARLRLADADFKHAADAKPFATFEILPAWSRFRAEAVSNIDALQLTSGALDQTNTEFTALNTRITTIRKLPADWTAFGALMRTLDTLRDGIADLGPPATLTGRSTIEAALMNAERGEELATVESLATRAAQATALIATAQSWRTAWDRSARLSTLTTDTTALSEIGQAQRRLWLGFDEPALTAVKLLLDSVVNRIVTAGGNVPISAQRETVLVSDEQPTVPPEVLRLQRDDTLAVLIALALAVLVGLNAEYFGKPFGSLADYSRVLVWALSASIGVDLASLGLNRLGATLGGSGISRA